MRSTLTSLAVMVAVGGLLSACGGDEDGDAGRPQIVVTTNILGDVVSEVVGDAADVEVIVPAGADPHSFAASTRQAEAMADADLLVVNGAGFEAALDDVVESARRGGTPVFEFDDHVELLELDGADDPHLWTDPVRVASGVRALGSRAGELDGVDADAVGARAAAYADQLEALDVEIRGVLADIPDDRRLLVTNHEVLGYLADRYGFEVVGAVIPSVTTGAGASAAGIEALADLLAERRVPAIFGETTQPTELAEALADESGVDVEIVELHTESLGAQGSGADTYIGMMRTNAERIRAALG